MGRNRKRYRRQRSSKLPVLILCCLLAVSVINQRDRIPSATALREAVNSLRAVPTVTMSWPCNEVDSLALMSDSSSKMYSFSSEEEEMQVFSCLGGTVTESLDGHIVISHGNGLETVYDGCTDVYVQKLDKVRKGELIASIRGNGRIPQLGFQILKEQQAVDIGEYF